MRALERPYPSFSLVLSQQSCLATYRVSHFGGYYAKSSRMLDLEDPLMVSCCTTRLLVLISDARDREPSMLVTMALYVTIPCFSRLFRCPSFTTWHLGWGFRHSGRFRG